MANNKLSEKALDSYEFATRTEAELVDEVREMETNSTWKAGITSKLLKVSHIEGPLFAGEIADKYGLEYGTVFDTAADSGMKLLVQHGTEVKCLRDTSRNSLYETAKLNGAALGRMHQYCLAQVLNHGLEVARGSTLMLERYGKVSALHSDDNGGYRIMPISELLDISRSALESRFGVPHFVLGGNSHSYTSALWELPDAQSELLDIYQKALQNALPNNHAINFMPVAKFSSSDTAGSCAYLTPMFQLSSGVTIRFCDGVKVKHKRGRNKPDGNELFEQEAGNLYAMFRDCAEIIERMGKTEIWNPVNCLVGICNKLKIAQRYADAAREDIDRYCLNSNGSCSMHDIYLSMAECVAKANQLKVSRTVISNLEESIAKVLTLNWSDYDVGGVVAWQGNAA